MKWKKEIKTFKRFKGIEIIVEKMTFRFDIIDHVASPPVVQPQNSAGVLGHISLLMIFTPFRCKWFSCSDTSAEFEGTDGPGKVLSIDKLPIYWSHFRGIFLSYEIFLSPFLIFYKISCALPRL
jgi:hypothetical protein